MKFKKYCFTFIFLLLLGVIYVWIISTNFTYYNVLGDLTQTFNGHDIKGQVRVESGEFFATITIINEVTEKELLDNLHVFYKKISKRNRIKANVEKTTIMINDINDDRIMTSVMFRNEIFESDWKKIKTYQDLIDKASVRINKRVSK